MDIQDILIYVIVSLCIVYAGRHFLKFFRKKPGQTGCNCSGCAGCGKRKRT